MSGFWYIATPYRGYMGGHVGSMSLYAHLELAAAAAFRFTAKLIDHGVEAYSPIAHSHEIGKRVTLAPPNSDFWLDRQLPFMEAAIGCIVAKIPGWDKSAGIKFERDFFDRCMRPVIVMDEHFDAVPVTILEYERLYPEKRRA